MAVAQVQTKLGSNFDSATTVVSFDAAPAAGNLVAVGIAVRGVPGVSISSVVDTRGNTYQLAVDSGFEQSGRARVAIYYAENIDTGSPFTVTVTYSANARGRVTIVEMSGAATSSALDGINSAVLDGSTSAASGSVSPTGEAGYIALVGLEGSSTISVPDDWSQLFESEGTVAIFQSDSRYGAGSQSATWTLGTSRNWAAAIAAFVEPAPDPPDPPDPSQFHNRTATLFHHR